MSVRVALIGCGAWGYNVLRTLMQDGRANVVAVADPNPARLARAHALTSSAILVATMEEALSVHPDAVVIATPANTHAALVLAALDAGVDVFVEKPMTMTVEDAERCVAKAVSKGRIGMVGHLLCYHPAVVRLIELTRESRFGEVLHFSAARLGSSSDRASSILWSLGPHDVSVLRMLDPSPVASIDVEWNDDGARVVVLLRLESAVSARIELSRLSPTKERRISVTSSLLTASFDDVRAPSRIALQHRCAKPSDFVSSINDETIHFREPLAIEMGHFLECVEQRAMPLTPFEEGAEIVRTLARIEATARRHQQSRGLDFFPGDVAGDPAIGG